MLQTINTKKNGSWNLETFITYDFYLSHHFASSSKNNVEL